MLEQIVEMFPFLTLKNVLIYALIINIIGFLLLSYPVIIISILLEVRGILYSKIIPVLSKRSMENTRKRTYFNNNARRMDRNFFRNEII